MIRRLSLLTLPLSILGASAASQAATFTVNTTADTFDYVCDNWNCSLKDALYAAEQTPAADDVILQANAVYSIATPTPIPMIGMTALLPGLATPVILHGHGARIQATVGNMQIFFVQATGSLAVHSVTIANAWRGVTNKGAFSAHDSFFTGNNCSLQGGAIYNDNGTLALERCTFSNNSALFGGAVFSTGSPSTPASVSISRCSFVDNHAYGNGAGAGGALRFDNDHTALTTDTTFSGNTADYAGGGVAFWSVPDCGVIEFRNVTITNNSAPNGGGIFYSGCPSYNPYCPHNNDPIFENSIIANNVADCYGHFASAGYNILGLGATYCNFAGWGGTDTGVSSLPGLAPLSTTGAPGGASHQLTPGSLPVNNGSSVSCNPVDQLAQSRVATCDIGAVELHSCTAPPPSMMAWWTFDETTGWLAGDLAGPYNDQATGYGPPVWNDGEVLGAACLDGSSQYLEANHTHDVDIGGACPSGAEDFTIDAWVRTTSTAKHSIVDKIQVFSGAGLGMADGHADEVMYEEGVYEWDYGWGWVPAYPQGWNFFTQKGRLGFEWISLYGRWNTTLSPIPGGPIPDLSDGQWHLVAVTARRCGSANATLYIDGKVVATFTPPASSISNTANLLIGRLGTSGTLSQGCFDEIELFNRSLSQAELDAIYDAGTAGKCKQPRPHCPTPGIPCD